MSCSSRHHDFDRKEDFRRLEVILKDILFQLQKQQQKQYQNQDQDQYQDQYQGQAQSDRTKFENIGNPNVIVKNEANALSIAAIVILLSFLNDYKDNVVIDKDATREIVNMLKELDNSSE
ncbi:MULTISPECIES: hypothetical protein [Virgibacillus]|uniref:Uncharacterized protein n=1 Tax=Virgibacillus dokdonensis TaxID=302167 RepID=A0ABU7VDL9_9BACI|nr:MULTISPECIES: hypothetical protein [Virgibacillus]NWO12528.1 hypothetical protein [Virgibacillus sp.]